MAKAKKLNQTIEIPKALDQKRSLSPKYPKTPGVRTPADEAIDFFESGFKQGDDAIRVYELALDPDGGPNKDRSVAYRVFFVHVCLDASHLREIVALSRLCVSCIPAVGLRDDIAGFAKIDGHIGAHRSCP